MALATALLTTVIVLVALMMYFKRRQWRSYWPEKGVKFLDLPTLTKGLLTGDIEIEKQAYEALSQERFGGYMEMWNPVLFVKDLDLIKAICIKDFDHFVDHRSMDFRRDPHLHHGLFFTQGDYWKDLRTKMSPTFSTSKIKSMFNIFDESARKFTAAMKARAAKSPDVEVRELHQKVLMDIIVSAAFGIQTDLFEDTNSLFYDMGNKISGQFTGRNKYKFWVLSLAPLLSKFLHVKLTNQEADDFLSRVIKQVLAKRRGGEKREDFIQLMLAAQREQMATRNESNDLDTKSVYEITDDVIVAQCFIFILGGFDTVETLLVWASHVLATRPDIQGKLYHEVKSAYDATGGKFTYDNINQMEYLDGFVQETLRFYPPVVRLEHSCTKTYKIPDTDIAIHQGTVVVLPVYQIHMDPNHWPSPREFKPERFRKEESTNLHPCAFLPFGLGPRFCIGNRFALIESKLVIAHMVLNFQLSANKKTASAQLYGMDGVVKPDNGMWITAVPRG